MKPDPMPTDTYYSPHCADCWSLAKRDYCLECGGDDLVYPHRTAPIKMYEHVMRLADELRRVRHQRDELLRTQGS